MVGFYKHDIPAWMDGTERLSDGAYRAYHVIVQLIMLHEGPITLNERGIAGRCNQSVRSFRKNLDELRAAGKLSVEDGRLHNHRAADELVKVNENRSNAALGGRKSAKSRGKSPSSPQLTSKPGDVPSSSVLRGANHLKTHDPPEAPLREDRSLKDKTRLDETERTDSAASNGSARAELDRIQAALRCAAGLEFEKTPSSAALFDLSPILGLLDAGFNLEEHILPVLRAKAQGGHFGHSWAYYVPAIRESADKRSRAAQSQRPQETSNVVAKSRSAVEGIRNIRRAFERSNEPATVVPLLAGRGA